MENLDKNLEEFQGKIRYYFNDKELLIEALSHSSYANEKRKGRNSNERLEFWGTAFYQLLFHSICLNILRIFRKESLQK